MHWKRVSPFDIIMPRTSRKVRYNKNILTDDDIWNIICENCGARNISEFQALPRPQQKHFMYLIHEMGVGPRTMSRISGIPYSIVQRATSNENQRYNNNGIVGEENEDDALYYTYCDKDEFEQYPEY